VSRVLSNVRIGFATLKINRVSTLKFSDEHLSCVDTALTASPVHRGRRYSYDALDTCLHGTARQGFLIVNWGISLIFDSSPST